MNKTILFSILMLLCSMQLKSLPLEDLTKKDALKIYQSLERLTDSFGKNYQYNSDANNQTLMQKLTSDLDKLRTTTKEFPSLTALVDAIEQAIQNNNSSEFWQSEKELRNFIRPAFRENPLEKKQQSYFAAALTQITNAAHNLYQWLFVKKQTP